MPGKGWEKGGWDRTADGLQMAAVAPCPHTCRAERVPREGRELPFLPAGSLAALISGE